MPYFSEREEGEQTRENEEIGYPKACTDEGGPVGADETAFWQAMWAEIPTLQEQTSTDLFAEPQPPPRTLDILDMIEFCWRCVGKPIHGGYHEFFKHYHLMFDIKTGREEFCEAIVWVPFSTLPQPLPSDSRGNVQCFLLCFRLFLHGSLAGMSISGTSRKSVDLTVPAQATLLPRQYRTWPATAMPHRHRCIQLASPASGSLHRRRWYNRTRTGLDIARASAATRYP